MSNCNFYASLLALVEMGLGGVLHAAKVPLRGQILSLNQIFLLSKASCENATRKTRLDPLVISCIAATLKVLSPMGARFTPMVAIAMQGALYSIGTLCFGHTILGRLLGATLSSVWTFIHYVVWYLLIFDHKSSIKWLSHPYFFYFLATLVLAKVSLSLVIVLSTPYIRPLWFDKYREKIGQFLPKEKKRLSPWRMAFKELMRPLFVFLVLISAAMQWAMTSDYLAVFWNMIRSCSMAYLLFFLIATIPVEKVIFWMRKKGFGKFGVTMEGPLSLFEASQSKLFK